jgi:hypothetical protein
MAGFTTAMPSSFKAEILQALHNFTTTTGNDFRVALGIASPTGTYGAATTNYGSGTGSPTVSNMGTDELPTATGYTQGGYDITAANNVTPTVSAGTIAYTTPGVNPSWTSATFSTSGCLMYNFTNGTRAAYVGSFGGVQTVSSGTFTILMPSNTNTTALLRIA